MKPSPVQLLQSTIEKFSVEANVLESDRAASTSEDVQLQVKEFCEPFAGFWEDQVTPVDGIAERTFMVRLSIRTEPEEVASIPYSFELVFSGVVACFPETLNGFAPALTAKQYGLAMIYGAMREQFLTFTSRMPHGARLLPTVSFMEQDPKAAAETSPTTETSPGKREGRSKAAAPKPARTPSRSQ